MDPMSPCCRASPTRHSAFHSTIRHSRSQPRNSTRLSNHHSGVNFEPSQPKKTDLDQPLNRKTVLSVLGITLGGVVVGGNAQGGEISGAWNENVPLEDQDVNVKDVLYVGTTKSAGFGTISDAIVAAQPGSTIRVGEGQYKEKLVLDKALTIEAFPKNAKVDVVWETSQPYENTILCVGQDVVINGLNVIHKSPSVANNYAVFVQGGNAVLRNCGISSMTGSGIGVEGSNPSIVDCYIHDCDRHGIAIFGGLEGRDGGGVVQSCKIVNNKLSGVLVRGCCCAKVMDSSIQQNGTWGLLLQDCEGDYTNNSIRGNKKGSVCAENSFDLDMQTLSDLNTLDSPVVEA